MPQKLQAVRSPEKPGILRDGPRIYRPTLKILGKTFQVKYGEMNTEPLNGNLGVTNHFSNRIHIAAGPPDDSLLDTIIHEVLHSLSFQLRLGFDEADVVRTAAAISEFLLNNVPEIAQKIIYA